MLVYDQDAAVETIFENAFAGTSFYSVRTDYGFAICDCTNETLNDVFHDRNIAVGYVYSDKDRFDVFRTFSSGYSHTIQNQQPSEKVRHVSIEELENILNQVFTSPKPLTLASQHVSQQASSATLPDPGASPVL